LVGEESVSAGHPRQRPRDQPGKGDRGDRRVCAVYVPHAPYDPSFPRRGCTVVHSRQQLWFLPGPASCGAGHLGLSSCDLPLTSSFGRLAISGCLAARL
jgi:hypothetical protein